MYEFMWLASPVLGGIVGYALYRIKKYNRLKLPAGWRHLEPGEITVAGDIYFDSYFSKWKDQTISYAATPSSMSSATNRLDKCFIPENHRLLMSGEKIILGDRKWVNGVWREVVDDASCVKYVPPKDTTDGVCVRDVAFKVQQKPIKKPEVPNQENLLLDLKFRYLQLGEIITKDDVVNMGNGKWIKVQDYLTTSLPLALRNPASVGLFATSRKEKCFLPPGYRLLRHEEKIDVTDRKYRVMRYANVCDPKCEWKLIPHHYDRQYDYHNLKGVDGLIIRKIEEK